MAVNLAATLAAAGLKVGLLDADVHGPSLPHLVTPDDDRVLQGADGSHNAVTAHGMTCMSYGWVAPRNAAGQRMGAVMRGPMVSAAINTLLRSTRWGELDVLVVDMPPGTGDVHISLGQQLPFSSAVVVTTPHSLATADVIKGVDMFKALSVPCSALVENFAWFEGDEGRVYFPFGRGPGAAVHLPPNAAAAYDAAAHTPPPGSLAATAGIPALHALPIDPALAASATDRVPMVVQEPAGRVAAAYRHLAQSVTVHSVRHALGVGAGTDNAQYFLTHTAGSSSVALKEVGTKGAASWTLPARHLRLACQCAGCVDEMTGAPLLQPQHVPEDVQPTLIRPLGNYAFAVKWSDGHTSSVYTHKQLKALAAESQ